MAYQKTQDEFWQELLDQQAALTRSAQGYDQGETWEAKRLATAVANIAYDSKKQTSVLSHLGRKAATQFPSSSQGINPNNLLTETPLVFMRL
jgi:hypothetical protein